MARIEKNQKLEQGTEDIQKETVEEAKEPQKKSSGHGWLKWGCGIFLLIILGLGSLLLYCLTASGLLTMPVVSDWFYKTPTPIHKVSAGPPLEAYVSETFGAILTKRLQSGSGVLNDRSVTVSLPEASITNSFHSIILDSEINLFDVENSQIAVDGQKGLEVFLPLANQINGNAVKIFLVPGVYQGQITIDEVKIIIGNLTFPSWVSDVLIKPFLKQGLNLVNQEVGRYASIEGIALRDDGTLDLIGTLVVEIMKVE